MIHPVKPSERIRQLAEERYTNEHGVFSATDPRAVAAYLTEVCEAAMSLWSGRELLELLDERWEVFSAASKDTGPDTLRPGELAAMFSAERVRRGDGSGRWSPGMPE